MLEFEEQRLKLQGYTKELDDLKDAIGYNELKNEIADLEQKAAEDGFWDNVEASQKLLQKTAQLKDKVAAYDALAASYEDTLTLIELADEEEDLS